MAHPRAGGENVDVANDLDRIGGSSPRGRGKLEGFLSGALVGGLIPARAGKTHPHCRRRLLPPAHPRAGGENCDRAAVSHGLCGSSPRGRGKHRAHLGRHLRPGLIPARAGKTSSPPSSASSLRAHPRAGGENTTHGGWRRSGTGSSPRGRGKPRGNLSPPDARRLIPARAGKTRPYISRRAKCKAHPRAGGENFAHDLRRSCQLGSSPRGRGKHVGLVDDAREVRLIPARAGKTQHTRTPIRTPRAHPRAGGENIPVLHFISQRLGSSPRGRGKRKVPYLRAPDSRLIPARAGKT
mgnify:CR=1 FL=1